MSDQTQRLIMGACWIMMAKPHSGIVRSQGRTHGLPTSHHSLTVLLGRVVILRSSGARVLRPIDSLASRQNVSFSNLWVRVEWMSQGHPVSDVW